jgi:hypothetical protein
MVKLPLGNIDPGVHPRALHPMAADAHRNQPILISVAVFIRRCLRRRSFESVVLHHWQDSMVENWLSARLISVREIGITTPRKLGSGLS